MRPILTGAIRPPQSCADCLVLLRRLHADKRYSREFVARLTDHYLDLWLGWKELDDLAELTRIARAVGVLVGGDEGSWLTFA